MPARKSDARRSDVSAARFVLADDESLADAEPGAAVTEAVAPSGATPSPSGPATVQTSPEKEREREKSKEKEKEKEKDPDAITIEDLTLPKSIITRLAKGVLPPNTQIQANAILALSKSATVFINHLANSANEFTLNANKKTIMPADVFRALDDIEYGFMRERVEAEFAKFNEVQTSKRSTYRKKIAAMKKATTTSGEGSSILADASMMSTASHDETDASIMRGDSAVDSSGQPRLAKKARIDPSREDSRMEVEDHDPSDAETVPDEHVEEEEEDDEEEVEEEEEEEEADEEEAEEDRDEDDERAAPDEDEALDEDSE